MTSALARVHPETLGTKLNTGNCTAKWKYDVLMDILNMYEVPRFSLS